MSTPLALIAKIDALPGHEDVVEAALLALVNPTLAENGCIQYDLHRDLEVPGRFMFYEIWATRGDWEAHNASPHVAALGPATEGKIGEVALSQLERIYP